jgi:hypothetical protein
LCWQKPPDEGRRWRIFGRFLLHGPLALVADARPKVRLVGGSEELVTANVGSVNTALLRAAADAKLTPEIAKEICKRTNSAAVLEGTVTLKPVGRTWHFGSRHHSITRIAGDGSSALLLG